MAHINSLIVGTHSRHNDSLFVNEGMVDREGGRGGTVGHHWVLCAVGRPQQADRKRKQKRGETASPGSHILAVASNGRTWKGLDSDSTDRRERKWEEESWDRGHISV